MSHSESIFICSADNLLGVWLVRNFMKAWGSSSSEPSKKIYAGVYCIRSQRAHELLTLGAEVIEISHRNKECIEKIAKSSKGVVFIPPLESRPNWYEDTEKSLECLQRSSPNVVVMLSSAVLQSMDNIKEEPYSCLFKKLKQVEDKFKQIGQGKKWAIVRKTPPQEFMLHFSRMIQETGTLRLPTGNGKCAYVCLNDVSCAVCELIKNPKSFQIYTLSGPEPLDGKQLVERLNRNVEESDIQFEELEEKYAERYLRTEFSDKSIALVYMYLGAFEVIKNNKLNFVSDDLKKLIHKEPNKIDVLFKEFRNLFRP